MSIRTYATTIHWQISYQTNNASSFSDAAYIGRQLFSTYTAGYRALCTRPILIFSKYNSFGAYGKIVIFTPGVLRYKKYYRDPTIVEYVYAITNGSTYGRVRARRFVPTIVY